MWLEKTIAGEESNPLVRSRGSRRSANVLLQLGEQSLGFRIERIDGQSSPKKLERSRHLALAQRYDRHQIQASNVVGIPREERPPDRLRSGQVARRQTDPSPQPVGLRIRRSAKDPLDLTVLPHRNVERGKLNACCKA